MYQEAVACPVLKTRTPQQLYAASQAAHHEPLLSKLRLDVFTPQDSWRWLVTLDYTHHVLYSDAYGGDVPVALPECARIGAKGIRCLKCQHATYRCVLCGVKKHYMNFFEKTSPTPNQTSDALTFVNELVRSDFEPVDQKARDEEKRVAIARMEARKAETGAAAATATPSYAQDHSLSDSYAFGGSSVAVSDTYPVLQRAEFFRDSAAVQSAGVSATVGGTNQFAVWKTKMDVGYLWYFGTSKPFSGTAPLLNCPTPGATDVYGFGICEPECSRAQWKRCYWCCVRHQHIAEAKVALADDFGQLSLQIAAAVHARFPHRGHENRDEKARGAEMLRKHQARAEEEMRHRAEQVRRLVERAKEEGLRKTAEMATATTEPAPKPKAKAGDKRKPTTASAKPPAKKKSKKAAAEKEADVKMPSDSKKEVVVVEPVGVDLGHMKTLPPEAIDKAKEIAIEEEAKLMVEASAKFEETAARVKERVANELEAVVDHILVGKRSADAHHLFTKDRFFWLPILEDMFPEAKVSSMNSSEQHALRVVLVRRLLTKGVLDRLPYSQRDAEAHSAMTAALAIRSEPIESADHLWALTDPELAERSSELVPKELSGLLRVLKCVTSHYKAIRLIKSPLWLTLEAMNFMFTQHQACEFSLASMITSCTDPSAWL